MSTTRREILASALALTVSPAAAKSSARPSPMRRAEEGAVTVDGLRIAVRRHASMPGGGGIPVLYVHGATFPSSLAVEWRFDDNKSWADDLVAAGHDVWAFDFAGYGHSQRYPGMNAPPVHGPLGRSDAAVRQLAAVAEEVRRRTGAPRVALLAHSWGTIVAARYAAEHPHLVDRLALFGPILRRPGAPAVGLDEMPSYDMVSLHDQITRFREDVPAGEELLISDAAFGPWGEAYLDTDPAAHSRRPPAVAVPNGPVADIVDARGGRLPYDPARITCPIAVLRGEWDSRCPDADIAWFRAALRNCRSFTDAKLERGTHLMHLETGRKRLWAAARNALARTDRPSDVHVVIFEVQPKADGKAAYLSTAASLRPLLDEVDGFQSIERFASRGRPDWILSLSFWADGAAIAAWRSRERHHDAQARGRNAIFEDYRLRVARIGSDTMLPAGRQPIGISSYRDPARRTVQHVAIVELLGQPSAALASQLEPLPGSREVEWYESLSQMDKSVCLVTFGSGGAAQAWHHGLAGVMGGARVRTMEVLRDYGLFDRAEAPQYHPVVAPRS